MPSSFGHTWLFLLTVSILTTGSLNSEEEEDAGEGQFPFQVTIKYKDDHLCEGALISRRAVLTSSRCCLDMEYRELVMVEAGAVNQMSEEAQVRTVAKIHSGSSRGQPSLDDVCVLILTDDLVLDNATVGVIAIERNLSLPTINTQCTLAGYKSLQSSVVPESRLMFANITLLDHQLCLKAYSDLYVTGSMTCSNCSLGDNGSPLVCDGRLAAILVHGSGCEADDNTKQLPATIFTKVANFAQFIDAHSAEAEEDDDGNSAIINSNLGAFLISSLIPLTLNQIIK